jgi:hypothetical protein
VLLLANFCDTNFPNGSLSYIHALQAYESYATYLALVKIVQHHNGRLQNNYNNVNNQFIPSSLGLHYSKVHVPKTIRNVLPTSRC